LPRRSVRYRWRSARAPFWPNGRNESPSTTAPIDRGTRSRCSCRSCNACWPTDGPPSRRAVGATAAEQDGRSVGHPLRRRRHAAGRSHRPVPLPRPAERATTRSAYSAGSRGPRCRRNRSARRLWRASRTRALGAQAELDVRLLHLGTSADAGGDNRRAVGYAAFALFPSTGSQLTVTGG
jgi:hypothetical protein